MGAKFFYVSAVDGRKRYLVAGPYDTHEEALGLVKPVRTYADTVDGRAHFMAWGTAGSDKSMKTPMGTWKG